MAKQESTKHEPIRVGDQFTDKNSTLWRVIETLPGGRVELFTEKQCRFVGVYTRDIRERYTRAVL